MRKVFVANDLIADYSSPGSQIIQIRRLFMDEKNVQHIISSMAALTRRYGKRISPSFSSDIRKKMADFAKGINDLSQENRVLEALDFYNKEFVGQNHPLANKHLDYDEPKPLHNPFKEPYVWPSDQEQMGEHMYMDEIRNLDLWVDNSTFADANSTRYFRGESRKGLNNPHIRGAHKRHYDREDANDTYFNDDYRNPRPSGYDNTELYATTGSYDWEV